MIAHVIERRVIDLVALITSAQQFQKIQPALSLCGGKPGEMIAADMGAIAIAGPMAGAGIVYRDPCGGLKPGAKNRPQRSKLTKYVQIAFKRSPCDIHRGIAFGV